MTRITRSIALCASILLIAIFSVQISLAQSVIDPADPVVNYNPASPPPAPSWMQMTKWVRTPNTNVQNRNHGWTADNYKCYNWQGLAFRVRFPKNYTLAADGKKYPLIVFLHGKGEIAKLTNGQNYDNEFQLLQGPYEFEQAILNDKWNGFVIAPQVTDLFYDGDFERIMQIVDYMIANNKVDPFGISVDGLSSGGLATFQIFNKYPLYFSSVTPISPPVQLDLSYWPYNSAYIANKKFTPIWISQGGVDTNPTPATTQQLQDSMLKYGANFKRTLYPTSGHGTWYAFWAEPDFWPFINRAYMSNPWMLRGLKNRWPGEPFVDTIGVMPGFDGYQWRYNGTVIPGQTSNSLIVTAPGKYESRILKGSLWSNWSPVPLVIKTGFYEAESYSSMSGIQTEATTDVDGGLNVGFIDNGDWMNYTINPYAAGTFKLDLRVAAMFGGGKIQILKGDGVTVLATVDVPQTGAWQTWTTISTTVALSAGTQTIRLKSIANTNWNINWLQFSIPAGGPLPVKFVYFNSQCKGSSVALQWKTAQEQDTKDFSIQRSTDGISWSEIGTVAAAGQSNQERSYAFVDRSPGSSSLYRIVENDNNGRYTISNIVKSSCSSARNEISLYPNPSSGNSALNISLDRSTRVSLRIVDSKGAVMQQSQLQLPSGNTTLPLNLSSYAEGVYTIDVRYDNEVKSIKLIKK